MPSWLTRLIVVWRVLVALLALTSYVHAQGAAGGWSGIEAFSAPPRTSVADGWSLPGNVVVGRVVEESPASKAGIRPGDFVISVNGRYIQDLDAYNAEIKTLAPGGVAGLVMSRGKEVHSVAIQLAQLPNARRQSLPDVPPLLRLETGGHMARIQSVVFIDEGQQLVSAGDDKTVRIWNVPSGELRRTFRSFQEVGPNGQINSLVAFPDRKHLAIGGYFFESTQTNASATSHVRILDAATGAVVSLLHGHADAINRIAISADGKVLVSGGADGMLIGWDLSTRHQKWRVVTSRGSIQDLVLASGDSRAVARFSNGTLGVWSIAEGRLISNGLDKEHSVDSMAYCRATGELAVADRLGRLHIYDAGRGERVRQVPSPRVSVGMLLCSPDGRSLLVACGEQCDDDYSATIIALSNGQTVSRFTGHNSRVTAAAFSPDSKLVATAGGHERGIAVWDADTGEPMRGPTGNVLSLNGTGRPVFAVGIDPTTDAIAWGSIDRGSHNSKNEPLEFRLQLPNSRTGLGKPLRLDSEAVSYSRATPDLDNNSLQATRGGKPERRYGLLELRRERRIVARVERGPVTGYEHTAYSLIRDGKEIVSGGRNGTLESYNLRGDRQNQFIGHEDVIWSVAASRTRLTSGGSDQTVRLWNVETGEQIVTLFHGSDDEWVMWTPQGFFTGSPSAGSLVGWQINNGIEKVGSYLRGEQYRNALHRKDIVERAIILGSAKAAVDEAFPSGFSLTALLSSQPPSIVIGSPADRASAFGGSFVVTAYITDGPDDLLGVVAYVNGHRVTPVAVPVVIGHPQPPPGWLAYSYEVPLFKGPNTVELVAYNNSGSSQRGNAVLSVQHQGEGHLDKRGTLHIVAVGVDDYTALGGICGENGNSSCNLSFAGRDATAFVDAISATMGPLHSSISTSLLVNGHEPSQSPIRANILTALGRLSEAKQEDTVVIFLAGHGELSKNGRYFFLPSDARKQRGVPSGVGKNLIDWGDIQSDLTKALGRRIVFVDACQAGAVNSRLAYNSRLLSDAKAEEFVAFAATSANELAEEHSSIGHGLFTFAILKRLDPKLVQRERDLRVYGLGNYLANEVQKMSKGRQEPQFYSGMGNFIIARPPP